MTFAAPASRPELPSRGEIWSILLGALVAGVLLASAFRLSLSARAPLMEEDVPGTARDVVVRPEQRAPAPQPAPRPYVAADVASR